MSGLDKIGQLIKMLGETAHESFTEVKKQSEQSFDVDPYEDRYSFESTALESLCKTPDCLVSRLWSGDGTSLQSAALPILLGGMMVQLIRESDHQYRLDFPEIEASIHFQTQQGQESFTFEANALLEFEGRSIPVALNEIALKAPKAGASQVIEVDGAVFPSDVLRRAQTEVLRFSDEEGEFPSLFLTLERGAGGLELSPHQASLTRDYPFLNKDLPFDLMIQENEILEYVMKQSHPERGLEALLRHLNNTSLVQDAYFDDLERVLNKGGGREQYKSGHYTPEMKAIKELYSKAKLERRYLNWVVQVYASAMRQKALGVIDDKSIYLNSPVLAAFLNDLEDEYSPIGQRSDKGGNMVEFIRNFAWGESVSVEENPKLHKVLLGYFRKNFTHTRSAGKGNVKNTFRYQIEHGKIEELPSVEVDVRERYQLAEHLLGQGVTDFSQRTRRKGTGRGGSAFAKIPHVSLDLKTRQENLERQISKTDQQSPSKPTESVENSGHVDALTSKPVPSHPVEGPKVTSQSYQDVLDQYQKALGRLSAKSRVQRGALLLQDVIPHFEALADFVLAKRHERMGLTSPTEGQKLSFRAALATYVHLQNFTGPEDFAESGYPLLLRPVDYNRRDASRFFTYAHSREMNSIENLPRAQEQMLHALLRFLTHGPSEYLSTEVVYGTTYAGDLLSEEKPESYVGTLYGEISIAERKEMILAWRREAIHGTSHLELSVDNIQAYLDREIKMTDLLIHEREYRPSKSALRLGPLSLEVLINNSRLYEAVWETHLQHVPGAAQVFPQGAEAFRDFVQGIVSFVAGSQADFEKLGPLDVLRINLLILRSLASGQILEEASIFVQNEKSLEWFFDKLREDLSEARYLWAEIDDERRIRAVLMIDYLRSKDPSQFATSHRKAVPVVEKKRIKLAEDQIDNILMDLYDLRSEDLQGALEAEGQNTHRSVLQASLLDDPKSLAELVQILRVESAENWNPVWEIDLYLQIFLGEELAQDHALVPRLQNLYESRLQTQLEAGQESPDLLNLLDLIARFVDVSEIKTRVEAYVQQNQVEQQEIDFDPRLSFTDLMRVLGNDLKAPLSREDVLRIKNSFLDLSRRGDLYYESLWNKLYPGSQLPETCLDILIKLHAIHQAMPKGTGRYHQGRVTHRLFSLLGKYHEQQAREGDKSTPSVNRIHPENLAIMIIHAASYQEQGLERETFETIESAQLSYMRYLSSLAERGNQEAKVRLEKWEEYRREMEVKRGGK